MSPLPSDAVLSELRAVDGLVGRLLAARAALRSNRLIAPLDVAIHRERFLQAWEEGEPFDPQFRYAEPEKANDELEAIRCEAATAGGPWHRLVADEAERSLEAHLAHIRHDAEHITRISAAEYGTPDAALLGDALALLAAPAPVVPDELRRSLDAARASAVMTAVLAAEGLDGWSTRLVDGSAALMSVNGSRRLISIRADAHFTVQQLVRLTVHEIGTHVFRWANAERGPLVLGLRLSGNTGTEEGLGAWHEQHFAAAFPPDRRFALRVVAVHAALRSGFTDVVRALVPHTDVRSAFDITVRVKRGLPDTGAPGGFLKDHVYLGGLRAVERHLRDRPGDHRTLMTVKWPLHRLALLDGLDMATALPGPLRLPDKALAQRARTLATVEA